MGGKPTGPETSGFALRLDTKQAVPTNGTAWCHHFGRCKTCFATRGRLRLCAIRRSSHARALPWARVADALNFRRELPRVRFEPLGYLTHFCCRRASEAVYTYGTMRKVKR